MNHAVGCPVCLSDFQLAWLPTSSCSSFERLSWTQWNYFSLTICQYEAALRSKRFCSNFTLAHCPSNSLQLQAKTDKYVRNRVIHTEMDCNAIVGNKMPYVIGRSCAKAIYRRRNRNQQIKCIDRKQVKRREYMYQQIEERTNKRIRSKVKRREAEGHWKHLRFVNQSREA